MGLDCKSVVQTLSSCTGYSRVLCSGRDERWEGGSPRGNYQCRPSSCIPPCTHGARGVSCARDRIWQLALELRAALEPDRRREDQGLRRPTVTTPLRGWAAKQSLQSENSRCPTISGALSSLPSKP